MNRKIIICGGGTAGHIYPAVAVIEEILENHKDCILLYIGTERGMEKNIIKTLGLNFKMIKATGLIQKGNPLKKAINALKFIASLIDGFCSSVKILTGFKPDIILGMGGYVCAPVLLAAVFLRKTFVLHEQNFIPGRLNRFFSRFCSLIFTSFSETGHYFNIPSGKIVFSGNPVRKIIREAKLKNKVYEKYGLCSNKFTITAFGGSLGAGKINNSFLKFHEYLKDRKDLQFLLISGKRFYEELLSENASMLKENMSFKIYPYINEMDEVYNITDLLISRSGANTIAEISACNVPSILVPYPEAIDNHQYYNASFLEKSGKAIIVNDSELDENMLKSILFDLEKGSKKLYNDLKNKQVDLNFINGHKTVAQFLSGENN